MLLSIETALGHLGIAVSDLQRIEVVGQWRARPVSSEKIHLIVTLQGEGALSLDALTMPLGAGELLMVADCQRPRLSAMPAQGGGLVIAHGVLGATLPDGRKLCDAMQRVGSAQDADGTPETAPADTDAAAIMICVVRRVVARLLRERWAANAALPDEKIRAQRQRLAKVIALMRGDPARQHTLESLADTAGMSRTAFHKMFTETYGKSPLALLTDLRLTRAEQLLTDTSLPIKTISMRLGYRSRSHFWQAFKKAHGVAPETYRNGVPAQREK